jgi:hypothetical protein
MPARCRAGPSQPKRMNTQERRTEEKGQSANRRSCLTFSDEVKVTTRYSLFFRIIQFTYKFQLLKLHLIINKVNEKFLRGIA